MRRRTSGRRLPKLLRLFPTKLLEVVVSSLTANLYAESCGNSPKSFVDDEDEMCLVFQLDVMLDDSVRTKLGQLSCTFLRACGKFWNRWVNGGDAGTIVIMLLGIMADTNCASETT